MIDSTGCHLSHGHEQTPPKHNAQPLPNQPHFHPVLQTHHSQHTPHFSQSHQCGPPAHMPEMTHAHQSPTISQHMSYLQPLAGSHLTGRLHLMPTSPAKFCDECGAPYLRETSKFCSECGTKRLGA
ncbi:unnamed protein product [Linum tenue]|uniref:Zinc-ribbon domain-containing protein n=1 Tax=Linum tenue TaxID=586396 RepID=A0AAV0R683_9ROSI|nr:unnamed protein product [Linum tenue]